eukprot:CAMPEP_0114257692 /NCGR_PEP_ID=MMETSP0058-20121206/18877_1 /TAXON_ID=36894 /ORGANISM="Pyramimonas parkeae, CCMP726" /LENGTH=362 /DNA_ID=CAMNT_0001372453 /DNA_START=229 /DNA_END=1317 /DNA_ORIENTATION=+
MGAINTLAARRTPSGTRSVRMAAHALSLPSLSAIKESSVIELLGMNLSEFMLKVSAQSIVLLKECIARVDRMINDPWKPEEVWVPVVYFICLRPILWNMFLAVQFLRGNKEKTDAVAFQESFFGFLYGPLYLLGVAFVINWFADTVVAAVAMADASMGVLLKVLGTLDSMMYILVFGYFLYQLQDYYLDEFFDMVYGKGKVDPGFQDLVHRGLEVGIIGATIMGASSALGASASILTGIYSLLGIGFGFASQEVLQNFFGGLMLVIMRPFQVGDEILISNPTEGDSQMIEGKVINIGYYQTILIDENECPTYVPNQWFVSVDIKNKSKSAADFKTRQYQNDAIRRRTAEVADAEKAGRPLPA